MDFAASGKRDGFMIKASVDIGSNTVLMLIAKKDVSGRLKLLDDFQRAPRLGRDVDKKRMLSEDGIKRVLKVLHEYKAILNEKYPEISSPVVTATSAVRDAGNGEYFIDRVNEETGWKVRLISGETEAKLTYKGALSLLELPGNGKNISVIDIGGGSTELILGSCSGRIAKLISLDLGCVRLTERYLNSSSISAYMIRQAGNEIQRNFEDIPFRKDDFEYIAGVAGTAVSLGAIKSGLNSYNADKLNGLELNTGDIEYFMSELAQISHQEAKSKYSPFLDGREDIFFAGCLILHSYLKWAGKQALYVSTGGLRHGLLVCNETEKLNF